MIYEFSENLIPAIFVKRYKRFFADCLLENGETVTAHCANTGSLTSCFEENGRVYLLKNSDPKKKLKYSWEISEVNGHHIGINTSRPNFIFKRALELKVIPEFSDVIDIKPEVKTGLNSRIDYLLTRPDGKKIYVEIKNVTLKLNEALCFPDAVTERGKKHLLELAQCVKEGHEAYMFYFCNRTDGTTFRIAHEIDADYFATLQYARQCGVKVLAYRFNPGPKGFIFDSSPLRVEF